MALFQLPHHFEALRCMAIERLWDGEQGREPMHHLMGDIMGYCRKAELTLDCPTEKILVGECFADIFTFTDCGVVYQVNSSKECIRLYSICAAKDLTPSSTEVSALCTDATGNKSFKCYYDEDTRKLYVLYNNGGVLLQHDMASGKTEEPISIPHLASCGGEIAGMIVVHDAVFIGTRGPNGAFEVFWLRLDLTDGVRSVYLADKGNFSFITFAPVPRSPRAVDLLCKSNSVWQSVRINVVVSDSPMLLGAPCVVSYTRKDEIVASRKIQGTLFNNTPGLGLLLLDEGGDRYVLRHPTGLRKVAVIHKRSLSILKGTPIIFDRWSFCGTEKYISGPSRLIRCQPYLL
ncbi:hypothetical protein FOZ60_001177 [Perkinsus olseni]|uniref:Uncharacterized protein n=1 Tax=Perkinsus olseni TaxID=32597 RepID=A0A7J6P1U8_PEROL|nr:hypothetical protein FOZ60_001177 [Perkinsus olseni]